MNSWTEADIACMQRALALAALGLNTTDPNPRVGCVLVRGERVIAEGWHERVGQPHAEALALRSAVAAGGADAAVGATAYVTLEPCGSRGRNPPCSQALIDARVARVVYGMDDPNPAKRHGAQQLRAAGIEVIGGLLAKEARALNPGFHKRHETGLPWVRLKLGVSLDGRTALASGASRWITSKAARHDAQRYRARSSAILTGIGTLLTDDPALNVRLEGATRQPLRVVLDSQLRAMPQSRVFERDGPTLVLAVRDHETRRAALEHAGAEVVMVGADAAGHTDLDECLHALAARGLNEIWVEAGATLSGALLAGGHVDELIVYYAPCLLGNGARGMADLPVLDSLDARLQLRISECQMVGDDLRVTALRA
jgi:diaminohydroxyphosphoribosylaminopyrimidine deaminase/5-amino-6-(5-phosphoribosylamino)uracil reductase